MIKKTFNKIFSRLDFSNFADTRHNILGLVILFALGLVMLFALGWHIEGTFFWLFAFVLFYWKLDSRISIGMALAGLVSIMLLLAASQILPQTLFIPSFWLNGAKVFAFHPTGLDAYAETVAVWVYFFLVIGVVKQMWEYRFDTIKEDPLPKPVEASIPTKETLKKAEKKEKIPKQLQNKPHADISVRKRAPLDSFINTVDEETKKRIIEKRKRRKKKK